MVYKGRILSNKFKRDKNVSYNTAFSVVLIRIRYSTKMRLKIRTVDSCRDIIDDINNKCVLRYDKKSQELRYKDIIIIIEKKLCRKVLF